MKALSDPRFTRAILLQVLADPFIERGGDIGEILKRNRISMDALSDPDLLVEASACYAAMDDMAAAIKDPYFGARAAQMAAVRGVPMLRDAAARAGTLGDFFIGAVLHVERQFNNVCYSLLIGSEVATLAIKRTRRITRPTIQADAIGIAFYTTILEACLGEEFDASRLQVVARTFDGLPPGFLPPSVLVRSQQVALSLSFPTEWLSAQFKLSWTAQMSGRNTSFSGAATQALITYVRSVIRDHVALDGFDLVQLAHTCDVSPRQLQRLLAARNTSFRSIRDDVRRDLAMDLVLRTETPLRHIALRTGFSGEAAFSRSYRRWTGTSPGAHRFCSSAKN